MVVASDAERVLEAVLDLGVDPVMTSPLHGSGTERVAEIMTRPEYSDYDTAVNVQCDQVSPIGSAIADALSCIEDGFPVATCAVALAPGDLDDQNRVKVELDSGRRALAFSRSAISSRGSTEVMLHVGIYAITRDALSEWAGLPAVQQEAEARLEQLRPLAYGMPMGAAVLDGPGPVTIDTLADLRRAHLTLAASTAELASRMTA